MKVTKVSYENTPSEALKKVMNVISGTEAFISGGSIANLVYGTASSDIDVYCKTRESLAKVTNFAIQEGYSVEIMYDKGHTKDFRENTTSNEIKEEIKEEIDEDFILDFEKEDFKPIKQGKGKFEDDIVVIEGESKTVKSNKLCSIDTVIKLKKKDSTDEIDIILIDSELSPEEYVYNSYDFDAVMLVMDGNGKITTCLEDKVIENIKLNRITELISISERDSHLVLKLF